MTNDLFRKYKSSYSSTANSFGIGTGVTITPASVSGLPTTTDICLTFDRVDTAGNPTTGNKVERIIGTISGGNFVVKTRGADGTTEQAHTSPVVEQVVNAKDWNDEIDGFLLEHTQTGAHDATKIATLAGTQTVTGDKTFSGVVVLPTGQALTSPVITGTGSAILSKTSGAITTDTDGATITMDMSVSRHQVILGASGHILALTNLSTGQVTIADLIQDPTGSRTAIWPSFEATATMTIATPCVVTTSKDIPTLTPVIFTTTGALPTGVTASTVYYYVRVNATTGNISTSVANAQAGTYIASSGSQSGVHTCAVQIRWPSQTAPTLSTGKFTKDRINFYCLDATNTVVEGQVAGQF